MRVRPLDSRPVRNTPPTAGSPEQFRRGADEPEFIVVRGAREHNLNIDELRLPKRQLVVFTGVSGSGKSSLAFDTLYAEGQRRYVESLSSYARQFLGQMEKPKYEQLRGLSPTIAIEQKSASSNPRSTVGTVTEIYDYLRVLYARHADGPEGGQPQGRVPRGVRGGAQGGLRARAHQRPHPAARGRHRAGQE